MTSPTADLADRLALDASAQDLLFRHARSANTFTDEPVSDEQVAALYDLIKWGPTAMNTQPLRLVVVRSAEAKARLVGHMFEGNKAKTAQAPLTVVLAYDSDFHEHLPTNFPHKADAKELFGAEEVRHGFAAPQAWLQAGYFILGVRALGLAAGPMAGFDAAGIDADLLVDTTLRSFAVVNVGHPGPDAHFDRLPRHDHAAAVITL